MQTLGLHLRSGSIAPNQWSMKRAKKCYYPSKIWNTVQDLAFSNHFEDGYEYELLIYGQAVHQGSGYLRRLIHLVAMMNDLIRYTNVGVTFVP
jgi:hypothetical protein